jgi:Na+-driven multidrug efflux pump
MLSFSWIPGIGFGPPRRRWSARRSARATRRAATRAGWRARRWRWACRWCSARCAWLPRPLARLFTDDAELVGALVPFLVCLALAQPLPPVHFALGGAHRGAGDTWTPFVASLLGNWGIRVPLAALFAGWWAAPVLWIWIVIVVDHAVRASWLALSFRRGRWR